MKNLEGNLSVTDEPTYTNVQNDSSENQGRVINNLLEYNNILTCSTQLTNKFNVLSNPLYNSPNKYLKKALFGSKSQMSSSNVIHSDDTSDLDSVSIARQGSLNDIVNDNEDKPSLNNYKTWPERCDKYKDNHCRETKTLQDSVNIHVNNAFSLEENKFCKQDTVCREGDKTTISDNNKDLPGCLDMSKNSGCPQGTMRLTQALDNISLAYNPITKQLHFVSPKNPDKNKFCKPVEASESDSKKGSLSDEGISLSNGDKCDSVSSESPGSTLVRTGHQRGTDGGSFSSTISSLSECSLPGSYTSKEDKDEPPLSPCSGDESKTDSNKGKKKGLSSFFSRGVFPWRSAGHSSQSPCKLNDTPVIGSTWRLFGGRSSAPPAVTTPAQPASLEPTPDTRDQLVSTPISSGASTPQHQRHRRQGSSASNGEGKLFDDLVASSIALIQHNRPSNLPAKDEAEEIRHRQEYQRIVEAARKREAREARERRKQLAKQARHEEGLSAALKEWNQSILPAWESMKNTRKARDLWWCGIPPAVRGKVWQLAIPNHLNITPQLYHICVERAKQKLVEVKFKKNVNGTKITSKQNGICQDANSDKMHCPQIKVKDFESSGDCGMQSSHKANNGFCDSADSPLDRLNKLSHINHDALDSDCMQQDELHARLSDRNNKDFSRLRNYSEQNLTKHTELSALKKSSQSDPDLCEYNNERSMELIQLDISRTFPNLCIFQPGGPYFDVLHELLAAYVCYRPDVGYVQGMSFLAAILILNMEAAEAFICFANLLNGPVLRAAFTLDARGVQALWAAHLHLLQAQLPALHAHHENTKLGPELYLLEWLYSGFAKAMPLDVACRVWDVFLRDGEEFLFRTALGVLHLYQEELLRMDFITASQFLTKLPEDLSADALFKSISCINTTLDKVTFQQLVDKYREDKYTVLDDEQELR